MGRFIADARGGQVPAATIDRLRQFVARDDAQGYRLFYELVRDRVLPRHCYDEWVVPMYADHAADRHSILEAFRGSTKTTTISETFLAYQVGLHPERSNLFVQADETKARKHAKNAADLIAHNPMWKLLFPTVVPDEDRGWGAEGFWVRDTRHDYGNWVRRRDKDPSLVGGGIFESFIVGMHPNGALILDDINNDRNTESAVENERANRLLTDSLFPVSEDVAWHMFCQTPWTDRDALALAKATGVYSVHSTPVYRPAAQGEPGAVFFEPREEWVRLTWPEKFNLARTTSQFYKSGPVGFARMYLLNLEAAKGYNLRREWVMPYPAEEIRATEWPVFMGIDYASVSDRLSAARRSKRDFFVAVWGYLSPLGQLVVVDGIREQISQAEAEQRTIALATAFPRLLLIGIESIGKGEEFAELIQRAGTYLPVMPIPSHTGEARSKGGRFERVLAPAFQRREIMISSAITPFLAQFLDEWVSWDGRDRRGMTDDTLDGVYMLFMAARGFIQAPSYQPRARLSPLYGEGGRRPRSPLSAWGAEVRARGR
jgi:hypothetical protein